MLPTEQPKKRTALRWIATALFHGMLALAIFALKTPKKAAEIVTISVVDAKEKKKPPPPPPAPPRPAAVEQPVHETAKPPPARAPSPARSPLPSIPAGPTSPGPGGDLEVAGPFSNSDSNGPAPGPAARPPAVVATATASVHKALAAPPPPPGECSEPAQKPKPKSVPQPGYPEAARQAEVQGKVRVEVSVDERGVVTSARVVSGLGHGLDEAALAAARAATFSPGTRCGKPVAATFVIGIRFSL